ncbi:MAG: hypothetical protein ACRCV7_00355 [Culicoidibacterales bacterium]
MEVEFGGFTTAGSFACTASWGRTFSSGSSFSIILTLKYSLEMK